MKRKTKILVLVLALILSTVDTVYSQIFVAGEANDQRKSELFSGYQGGMTNGSNDEKSNFGPGGGGGNSGVPLEGYTVLGSGALVLAGFAVLFLIAKRKKKGSSEPK